MTFTEHRGGGPRRPALIQFDGVSFVAPSNPASVGRRLYGTITVLVGLGVWAVLASQGPVRVLGILSGIVYLEFALAGVRAALFRRRFTTAGLVVYDEALAARISVPLKELCARAGQSVPTVVFRGASFRQVGVFKARNATPRLFVSKAWLDRVTDAQLRAVLAHEVAHLANGDLAFAQRRNLLAVLPALALAYWLQLEASSWGHASVLRYEPIFFATVLVCFTAFSMLLSPLQRPRERRADLRGAELSGAPDELAAALLVAQQLRVELRRQLRHPRWLWVLLVPISWRPPTHPPIPRRVVALQALVPTHVAAARGPAPRGDPGTSGSAIEATDAPRPGAARTEGSREA